MRLRRKGTIEADAPLRAPRGKAARPPDDLPQVCVFESHVVRFLTRLLADNGGAWADTDKPFIEAARQSLAARRPATEDFIAWLGDRNVHFIECKKLEPPATS
jgi:hypothetical protein